MKDKQYINVSKSEICNTSLNIIYGSLHWVEAAVKYTTLFSVDTSVVTANAHGFIEPGITSWTFHNVQP